VRSILGRRAANMSPYTPRVIFLGARTQATGDKMRLAHVRRYFNDLEPSGMLPFRVTFNRSKKGIKLLQMGSFHVIHAACVAPMVSALTEAGAPVERMLRQCRLDRFRLDDPDAFLPAECAHRFFESVARKETGPSLPYAVTSRYVLANMGGFGTELMALTDLRAVISFACLPEVRQMSYEDASWTVQGERAHFVDGFNAPPSLPRT